MRCRVNTSGCRPTTRSRSTSRSDSSRSRSSGRSSSARGSTTTPTAVLHHVLLVLALSGCSVAVRLQDDDVHRAHESVEVAGLVVLFEFNDVAPLVLDCRFECSDHTSDVDIHSAPPTRLSRIARTAQRGDSDRDGVTVGPEGGWAADGSP